MRTIKLKKLANGIGFTLLINDVDSGFVSNAGTLSLKKEATLSFEELIQLMELIRAIYQHHWAKS